MSVSKIAKSSKDKKVMNPLRISATSSLLAPQRQLCPHAAEINQRNACQPTTWFETSNWISYNDASFVRGEKSFILNQANPDQESGVLVVRILLVHESLLSKAGQHTSHSK